MIEIKDIHKSFGSYQVLKGINLNIDEGKVYGIVGINGAGKSTLMRLISGIYLPDKGDVLIDSKSVYKNPEMKRDVFFLNDDLFSHGTYVHSLVEFYKSFYNFDEDLFNEIISELKLDVSNKIKTFSKGMKRQMFLAIALASRSKYILLDEAFDGLDPLARMIVTNIALREVKKSNLSLLVSSHSLRELEDFSTSFGLLDEGKLIDCSDFNSKESNVFKFQMAFESPLNMEDFKELNPLHIVIKGRVVEIVCEGDKKFIINKLNELKPLMIESLPMSFEEAFIIQVKKKGYKSDASFIL